MLDMDQHYYIYRTSIRLRSGRRIYAWQYGLSAFKLKLKREPSQLLLPGI